MAHTALAYYVRTVRAMNEVELGAVAAAVGVPASECTALETVHAHTLTRATLPCGETYFAGSVDRVDWLLQQPDVRDTAVQRHIDADWEASRARLAQLAEDLKLSNQLWARWGQCVAWWQR